MVGMSSHYILDVPAPKVPSATSCGLVRLQGAPPGCLCHTLTLMYLPPYSPDLNLIEEFFAELKAFIKCKRRLYEENPAQGFEVFLEWCIDCVGSRKQSARGHFRHSGWTIDEI
jgi:transposase